MTCPKPALTWAQIQRARHHGRAALDEFLGRLEAAAAVLDELPAPAPGDPAAALVAIAVEYALDALLYASERADELRHRVDAAARRAENRFLATAEMPPDPFTDAGEEDPR
ncbi:hypothetical protein GCM10012275_57540 [Longimycelium tulufanense]|uniref:Uncharacterized protein n=1 Tax=Longimycelium tulufanense TaxID=907463 RepID=A0A8J3CKV3_9PSEU|nr:hypothetical protein [Longimycelium tulufanense]GGM79427.1 hypothetical protein GCM10012275_57540 [Longimycelium tulufanense]